MIYIMSDIHGEFEKYHKALELIDLKVEDTLYILGDVVDRGTGSIKILQDMMKRPNIKPLIGNHEYMALTCLTMLGKKSPNKTILTDCLKSWYNNGGLTTFNEFNELSKHEQKEILNYLGEFEIYQEVKCNGKSFVLVHGGLDNFDEGKPLDKYPLYDLIFSRADYEKVYFKDKFLVTGHTPTDLIWGENKVYKKNNHIAIDCGCVFGGNLAVYCLDNDTEIYI